MTNKVFIIDDDPAMQVYLSRLLARRGYDTALHSSAEEFLEQLKPSSSGCVLADQRLPGMTGIELQVELKARECELPVIIITGYSDVATARGAFLAEAVDFISKPVKADQLQAALERALKIERKRVQSIRRREKHENALALLTRRERELLDLVGRGLLIHEIAAKMKIQPRTVETHKFNIMKKLGARNTPDLVRFALEESK